MKKLLKFIAISIIMVLIGYLLAQVAFAAPTQRTERTLVPQTTDTYDLGTALLEWRNLYLQTLVVGGTGTSTFAGNVEIAGDAQVDGNLYAPITFTAGDTEITGNLIVENALTASNIVATSTTATSTFAGGLTVDSTDFVVDPDAGRVGIGTANPSSKLQVENSGAAATIRAFASGYDAQVSFGDNTDNWAVGIDQTDGSRFKISGSSAVGTDDKLTITTGGNVGIGSTDPAELLELAATNPMVRLRTTSPSGVAGINFEDSTGAVEWALGFRGTDEYFYIGNDDQYMVSGAKFVIDNSGNIGIGTTTPITKLSVKDGGLSTWQALDATVDHFTLGNDNGIQYAGIGLMTSSADLYIGTDNDPQLLIMDRSTGNVGINTTAPNDLFTVVADSDASQGIAIEDYSTNALKQALLTFRKSASNSVGTKAQTADGEELGEIGFTGVNSSSAFAAFSASIIGVQDGSAGATYVPGALTFLTGTNAAGVSERMRIDNSGNVGIGTTSPSSLLQISSNGASTDPIFTFEDLDTNVTTGEIAGSIDFVSADNNSGGKIQSNIKSIYEGDGGNMRFGFFTTDAAGGESSPSEKFTMLRSGNIGIGTTSPSLKLDVVSSDTTASQLRVRQESTGDAGIRFDIADTSYWTMGVDNSVSDSFKFAGSSALGTLDYLTILRTSGNVGIGIVPSQKLHISGNFLLENNTEIRQKDSGGTERTVFELDSSDDLNIGGSYAGALKFIGGGSYTEVMRIHDDGNVGIGTTSPARALDVAGSITLGNSSSGYIFNSRNSDIIAGADGSGIYYSAGSSAESTLPIFIGDNNDYIRLSAGNFERMRVDGTTGNVGIGTTSPSAKLSVQDGHQIFSGTAPSVSSCGTTPSVYAEAVDNVGHVTAGTGTVNSCTITFANAWNSEPHCIVQSNDSSNKTFGSAETATTLIITSASNFAGEEIDWICFGTE